MGAGGRYDSIRPRQDVVGDDLRRPFEADGVPSDGDEHRVWAQGGAIIVDPLQGVESPVDTIPKDCEHEQHKNQAENLHHGDREGCPYLPPLHNNY